MDVFFHLAFLVIWMKNPHLSSGVMGVMKHVKIKTAVFNNQSACCQAIF